MKYKVYCEKPGGSYHPDWGYPFYGYETDDIEFAINDYDCYRIVKIENEKETVLYDASIGFCIIKDMEANNE